jgi:hypothetical protein
MATPDEYYLNVRFEKISTFWDLPYIELEIDNLIGVII